MASPACPLGSDKVFGPRVDASCRAFDFTLLFEDIFFACLPAAVFLSLLPSHIAVLRRSTVVCSVRTKLLLGKLITFFGIFVAQVVFLAFKTRNFSVQTRASVAADVLSMIGTTGMVLLSYVDHQRSLRPSTLLSLYLSVLVILAIARVRTLWLMGDSTGEAGSLTATLALTITALLLESTEKKSILSEEKRTGAPEEYSGFWTRTAFAWLAATFWAGYSKVINQKDLPKIDSRLQSHILHDHHARHSLLRACFRENLSSFLSGIPPRLCRSVFFFSQPMLINVTVSYVGEGAPDPSYGRALIGAWALVFLGIACTTALGSYQTTRFVTRLKGGLIGLIYQETMKARTVDLGPTTAVAVMGTDVERIGQNFQSIHEMWASIIEVAVAIWLLEQQIFLACLAPVAVIINTFFPHLLLIFLITGPLSNSAKTAQKLWIEKVQERLRITSAMLDDMKAVKMLGLSSVTSEIVESLRRAEIEKSEVYRKLMCWNVGLSNAVMNLAPLATFAIYVIISLYWKDGSLLTAQTFTSIALINLLTTPVLMLIQLMPQLLQCISFFDRIQEYCNYAEDDVARDESNEPSEHTGSSISLQSLTRTTPTQPADLTKHVLAVENKSFAWEKSKPYFLKDISLRILPGTVTVCVGVVGSGKTMLLESILGETVSNLGKESDRSAPIAYCTQQPWLENTSIRNNIIGASHYDAQWYKTVQSACALDADFRTLERGDKTTVGSKGLNLSGGQKQRIALARAVYSRRNIVVLDDVFSGMDAHTVDHVSRQLLSSSGLFRSRGITVILATHSHIDKLMSFGDTIVALEDGRIVEMGSPQELQARKGYVANLNLSTSSQNQDHIADQPDHGPLTRVDSTIAESLISTADAIEAEEKDASDATRKNGDWSVYSYYFSSSGYMLVASLLTCLAAWTFCTEFATVWLDWWSEANEDEPNQNVGMYMGVYTALCLLGACMIAASCKFAFVDIISRSSFRLHSNLLAATMQAPLRFFTSTDTGTLTNRFSQDMELIDMNLPIIMVNYISTGFSSVAKAIILVVFSRYLAATVPFVLAALYALQSFYLRTSRQVRLLEIEAKAPLYTHFLESVAGAATIRAFGWQSVYQERNYKLIDQSQRPAYLQYCIQHWLSFVLDMLVTALAVILVAVIVTWKDKFTAGNVGVSLVMVMTFSTVLMRLIKMWTMMESSIGAVARVKRFATETESEERDSPSTEVAADWPRQGAIEFRSLVAAHGPDSEPVIKGLSMSIKPGEHVAICGRSGSGKTSLILALLQMLETQEGRILVDGVDVSTVSLTDTRSHLNVVPQDPFLMPGTIRFNIDPFGKASDEDITRALERVHLWPIVKEQGGVGAELDTAAWSAGQKQLLCLARAMVRNSKVLILDEATSSVDSETETIMQDIIDTVFRDCTVLAVMHRLTHIGRYDKVALLDHGHLMEFDAPARLLDQESKFASLHQSSAIRS
ncbi:ABC transporter [Pestalotiopsis sp. NC0098]|nr:ABC transporter [Pestalotiopsis sp. NC0098]